ARLLDRLRPAAAYETLSAAAQQRGEAGLAWYTAVRSASWAYTADRSSGVVTLHESWQREIELAQARAREATDRAKREARKRADELRCRKRSKARPKRRAAKRRPHRRRPSSPATARPRARPGPPTHVKLGALLLARVLGAATGARPIDQVQTAFGKRAPTTVDGALALIAGYAELFQAAAFTKMSQRQLAKLTAAVYTARGDVTARSLRVPSAGEVEDAVRFACIAHGKVRLAGQLAALTEPGGRRLSWTATRRRAIAHQLFAAAKANLDYLHSLLPGDDAGAAAQKLLAAQSVDYVIAQLGVTRAGRLLLKRGLVGALQQPAAPAHRLLVLGAALASYLASSKLLAKMFTIGMQLGTGRPIRSVGSDEQLSISLDRARLRALESAHRALRLTGRVPAHVRVLIQTANGLRKQNLSGQVKALELYWRASLFNQLAEQLAH
ncbi:MAG: hypothetical protein ABI333_19330, partial [bacterium]